MTFVPPLLFFPLETLWQNRREHRGLRRVLFVMRLALPVARQSEDIPMGQMYPDRGIAVITGASTGIGFELARCAASDGGLR